MGPTRNLAGVVAGVVVAATVLLVSLPAAAVPFQFTCITDNDAADCAIGEAQISMDVTAGPGVGQVQFTFTNSGPEQSTIATIYFDDGSLVNLASVLNGPGVLFGEMLPPPGPNDLPGGNTASPPFVTTLGFDAGAVPPAPGGNGVDNTPPGEFVTLVFDLDGGQTVADVVNELTDGTLRAGLHVINYASGGSESLITPEPGSLSLLGLGLAALLALRRQRL